MRALICLSQLLVIFLLQSCAKKEMPALPPTRVSTFIVKPETIPANEDFVGVAESSHPVDIRSRVEGYLLTIGYTEGQFVNTGDFLFQIDPKPFQASLAEAKGELARQEAILWAANRSVERIKPLYEQKAASQRDYENALAHALASEANVESAKAHVEKAELNLGYTTITSPIAGLTTQAKYREGSLITPLANGLLTTVSIIDPIWVNFSISDNQLIQYQAEQNRGNLILPKNQNYSVYLTLANGAKYPYTGFVSFADPILDSKTGTMTVRSVFSNPNGILRPGQFVKVTVEGAFHPNAIFVPQEAILQSSKGPFVFVVCNNVAQMRQVQLGDWFNNYWVISSGLSAGDEVIVEGTNKVRQNSQVQIINKKNN